LLGVKILIHIFHLQFHTMRFPRRNSFVGTAVRVWEGAGGDLDQQNPKLPHAVQTTRTTPTKSGRATDYGMQSLTPIRQPLHEPRNGVIPAASANTVKRGATKARYEKWKARKRPSPGPNTPKQGHEQRNRGWDKRCGR